jgi:signal transduction histidine kinase
MRTIFPSLGIKTKYNIDFSLLPLGVLFFEISVFSTEVAKAQYQSMTDLLVMRLIHTLFLLMVSYGLNQTLKVLHINFLSYPELVFLGLCAASTGTIGQQILSGYFDIEPYSLSHSVLTGLLRAFIWVPAFLLIGSKRTEILGYFKDYEQRLITSTRAESRKSEEFREIQLNIQDKIRLELLEICKTLKGAIQSVDLGKGSLELSNAQIQPLIVGEELRRLSMKLETFGSEQSGATFLGQNIHNVRLLAIQFKILYKVTSRKAPLNASTYTFILLLLITPAYINFISLRISLVSYPLIAIAIYISSMAVAKTLAGGSAKATRNGSILIYLTGLIPFAFQEIGKFIIDDSNVRFPIFITVVILPGGYYIFMRVLQVLQPHAIDLVKNNELVASKELKETVTKIVSDEFSHTLSHRWAIYIHGKILTRLAATSLKLETAINNDDLKTYQSALDSLSELLSNPDSEFEKGETDLDSEIASRLDPWLGLLDIEFDIDKDLKTIRSEWVHEVGEVIEEIISNSMRHGKANELNLRVRNLGDNNIEITAVDNATVEPPTYQIRFGLGTRIFNLASDSRWSITRVDSKTVFKLVMAIE